MAKYFIHNGEQDSIIAELPAGWTALEVNSAERSAAIDPLENVDVVGAPCTIEEIDVYKNLVTEEKYSKWICIHLDSASTWAQFETAKTKILTNDEDAYNRFKDMIANHVVVENPGT